jgi:hypothetical protein
MGSGDRITFTSSEAFGIGFNVSRFPFALTINVHLLFWHLSIGIGRGYDDAR